ncbi:MULTISPECIES: winged helix-turn-helix domain-containing protein [unclassified Lysobacter]|uniref:winged helix-turn-helix domain-containing protein n=1 Tax=unclassified Lysobacter TaxID=2635362 RepID=UPI001BE9E88E|nr:MULTISPECIES: winged helix-turn-helix domain-containing protein [unclassified Lysobacter]MBT2746364.1 PD40 domain-containing protein [Lysobacter sp. ISL-42]MBT2751163.1 PD40 domain-containing protein [Lysobacter sp. ISL-50]MBT2775571.1 PD40 domain-containing protein [Lysobacter sp. ISL-54]MBT2779956.1 PD40 domain-containing protein [Lysobacter sp. ISL-52]
MPRLHEPSTPPLPAEHLRVGDCVVDIPLREIRAPGARRPRRITPKSMGVLLVLVDHADRVVSRDTLLAEVWPDTLPTDDVVTQAVTQLRKAFDEDRGNPRYIETIAKNGYRLLAKVEWLSPEATPAHDAEPAVDVELIGAGNGNGAETARIDEHVDPVPVPLQARPRGTWHSILGVIAAVVLLVAGLVWWSMARQPTAAGAAVAPLDPAKIAGAARPYRLITSMPGFELAPTLSPDAALVAYVAVPEGQRGTAILVQTTDQTPPRQLTRPSGLAEDSAPSWSPDGRSIAFLRVEPGVSCEVLMIAANGGAERDIGTCDPRSPPTFEWTPDGRGLIFGSMLTAQGLVGMRVLDLASGEWRAVPYRSGSGNVDLSPRFSPDGRWIVFLRNNPQGDFWRLPAEGGTAERLSQLSADVRGWDWLPDSRSILFGRLIDGDTRMFRLDLETGQARDLGIESAQAPAVAAARPAAAFVQRKPYFGLFRVVLGDSSQGAVHVVDPLFPSSARDMLPMVAPDGRQIVFFSDRSGSNHLWWADLDQPDSLRMLQGVQPGTRYAASWSADSTRVTVVGPDADGRNVVYEIVPASGRVNRLPIPAGEPMQALQPPDPARLLILTSVGDGRLRLNLFDRQRTPWRLAGAIDDISQVRVDGARNRLLFTRQTQAGLWQSDLALTPSSVRRIDDSEPVAERYRLWDVATETGELRYLDQQPTCLAMLRRIASPQLPPSVLCLDQSRRSAPNGFSLSPRGDTVYLSLAKWDGADIGYMDLPEEPKTFVPGWLN